jgi:hypothetical protein
METTEDKHLGKTTGIIIASLLGVFTLFMLWKFKKFPYQE